MTRVGPVGEMSIYRWFAFWFEIGASVLLNGKDITNVCRGFDDITGEAECLVTDGYGDVCVDRDGNLKTEIVRGRVEVMVP